MSSDLLPAMRVGISVIVPIVVAAAYGRLDLALFAMFGAMASIYGRRGSHADRLVMQLSAGLVQVAAVTTGVATNAAFHSPWAAVLGAGATAAAAAEVSDRRGWAPPGALFAVFAYGTCSAVPAAWSLVPSAFLVSAGAAIFALIVGRLGAVLMGTLRPGRTSRVLPARASGARRRAVGAGTAAVISFGLATALGSPHAYWAAVAGVVPLTQSDSVGGLRRAWHRLIGTLAGLLLAAPLLALGLGTWPTVASVAVLQVITEIMVVRRYAVAMVFITPMALLMTSLATQRSQGLLLDRAATTLLGVLVGVAVLLAQHDWKSQW